MSTVDTVVVSYDQPTVAALIVTYANVVLPVAGIESLTMSKAEGADAGTFSMTVPLLINSGVARAAMPNDIIAIYGTRASTDGSGQQDLGPSASIAALAQTGWGDQLISAAVGTGDEQGTIRGLQSPTCMMIGLIDHVIEKSTPGGMASLTISGRDLTKIFMDYDCGYFNTPTRQAYTHNDNPPPNVTSQRQIAIQAANNLAAVLLKLATFAINTQNSGTALLEVMLDTAMARDYGTSSNAAIIAEFGFPWRNWIPLDKLDPNFRHYNGASLGLTFQIQPSSMWANLQELRNEPFNRLFVTEDGFIMFDDMMTAITAQAPTLTIGPGEIREFETTLSDESLATFLTVLGAYETGRADIENFQSTLPQFGGLDGAGYAAFARGTGEAISPQNSGFVQRFGLRAKVMISNFALGFNQQGMIKLWNLLIQMMNNPLSGRLTVKGRPYYRVGQRVTVNYGHILPASNGATWYVAAVDQNYIIGQDWTTTLTLLYPSTGGSIYAP